MNNNSINTTIIYPNLRAAAAAVCQRWCIQEGYSDRFLMQSLMGETPKTALHRFYQDGSWWAFPPNSVIPVKIHDVIDVEHTLAQRVQIQHYSIALSIALLPDGCIAPHNHPEI
ncbi:MAG: hypothetical protein AAF383_26020 [Cyanobacteria bacterium P01_A01_bin.83]